MKKDSGKLIYNEEPSIKFGYNQSHIDPRDGLTLFGPLTKELTIIGNVGIIGPQVARTRMRRWLINIHAPVSSVNFEIARPGFPGFGAVFGNNINFEAIQELNVSNDEINQFLKYSDTHQRIHNLVNLYSDKLLKYVNDHQPPVSTWLVVIPDEIYQYGRPLSKIPKSETNIDTGIKNKFSQNNPFLFSELDEFQEAYKYEVNFHNQLKAKLLRDRVITQVIRESTIAFREFKNKYGQPQRDLTLFESAIAWNISTTLYYKLGGTPWKLSSVRDKVCYLGLVYKKIENSPDNRSACCAAQMFLDSGDGLVFKGNTGKWYNPETLEYHIDKPTAKALLKEAIDTYRNDNNDQFPFEVFIHAKTYFNDIEWEGFLEATEGKTKIVGVRIRPENTFKLYRDRSYPVPRGTALVINEKKAFLWTKGYIPKIRTVVGLETPNPISVEIIRGTEDINVVCQDVLSLTKLNYNSCIFGDGLPVTLRFANNIGEVITAGPVEDISRLSFRHYI